MVADFRRGDDATPIILMGYYNPIYVRGIDNFVAEAKAAGVDGLIIVDLPAEEAHELAPIARTAGIDLVPLVAPTTGDDRLPLVLRETGGFVYYISVTGITGTTSAVVTDVAAAVNRIRRHTHLPVAIGFGIRTPDQAATMAAVADGVVVGSALVSVVADNLDSQGHAKPGLEDAVCDLVGRLAKGVNGGAVKGAAE